MNNIQHAYTVILCICYQTISFFLYLKRISQQMNCHIAFLTKIRLVGFEVYGILCHS